MTGWRCGIALALSLALGSALAREIAPAPQATYEALFTPGDAVDARLANLIEGAKTEVLVNAFSFTSRARGSQDADRPGQRFNR